MKPKLKKRSSVKQVSLTRKTKSIPVVSEKPKLATERKPDSSNVHQLLGIYQIKQGKKGNEKIKYFNNTLLQIQKLALLDMV